MGRISALGNGNARPSIDAARVCDGKVFSQVSTGNAEGLESAGFDRVVRSGTVPAAARKSIFSLLPSMRRFGHCAAVVIARAIAAPSSPSTTYAVVSGAAGLMIEVDVQPQMTAAIETIDPHPNALEWGRV